jgi:hypothetical protein
LPATDWNATNRPVELGEPTSSHRSWG